MNYLPIYLLWFLCPLSGGPFDIEEKSIQFKSGENITLHLPPFEEIDSVIWSKGTNVFLEIDKTKNKTILNSLYNKVCHYNISSITICNATREDEGSYTVNIKYKNKSSDQGLKTKNVIYYVTEYSDFCGNTTHVETKGQVVHLPVDWFENVISCQWMNNKTEIGKITYNGTEIREITYSGTEMVRNDSGGRKFIISRNGYLSINDFKEEDQGIYTVIIEKPGAAVCNHTYYVTISSHISSRIIIACPALLVVAVVIAGVVCYRKKNCGARHNSQPRLEEQQVILMPNEENAEGVKQQESVL